MICELIEFPFVKCGALFLEQITAELRAGLLFHGLLFP